MQQQLRDSAAANTPPLPARPPSLHATPCNRHQTTASSPAGTSPAPTLTAGRRSTAPASPSHTAKCAAAWRRSPTRATPTPGARAWWLLPQALVSAARQCMRHARWRTPSTHTHAHAHMPAPQLRRLHAGGRQLLRLPQGARGRERRAVIQRGLLHILQDRAGRQMPRWGWAWGWGQARPRPGWWCWAWRGVGQHAGGPGVSVLAGGPTQQRACKPVLDLRGWHRHKHPSSLTPVVLARLVAPRRAPTGLYTFKRRTDLPGSDVDCNYVDFQVRRGQWHALQRSCGAHS
jgi:hypothetical protein